MVCFKICVLWSSHCGAAETNLTMNHEVAGLIPGLAQWVKDPALLWGVVWVTDRAQIPHCCCCGNCKNRGSGRRHTALGDMEKQGLYSTSAGSEESPPESEHQVFVLSNFIHYKVLIFPCKHPGPPPSPSRQCSSLRNWASKVTEAELISNAGYLISRAAGLDREHTVVTLLQEGWHSDEHSWKGLQLPS